MKKLKKTPDTLLNTTFVTASVQGKNWVTEFFDEMIRNVKNLFFLRKNMQAATSRLKELEGRVKQMESFMEQNDTNPSIGKRIDKKR